MNKIEQMRPRQRTLPTAIVGALVLAVLLWWLPDQALAQGEWTTNGSNINNTNAGNVEVGTTTPQHPLHIVTTSGDPVKIEGTTPTAYSQLLLQGTGRRYHVGVGNGSETLFGVANKFFLYDGGAGLMRFVMDPNGNVGIGTANPTAKLEISGGNGVGIKLNPGWGSPQMAFIPTNPPSTGYGTTYFGFGYAYSSGITTNTYFNGGTYTTPDDSGASSWRILFPNCPSNVCSYPSDNFVIGRAAPTTGTPSFTDFFVVAGSGNIGVGTTTPTAKLDVNGDIKVTGNINAKYQDVAEWVPAAQAIPAGTVVVLDSSQSNQVIASAQAYDTRVAGVVSARPGLVLGEAGAGKVLVATTGRVKVKVDATRAPIRVGDLLVTSDKEGVAMKSEPLDLGGTPIHRPGTLIGKALEPLATGTGEILVLLSLQ